ncbi:MAG: C39 family peptidase [Candidatus Andersenbacteria bacterium]
MSKKKKFWGITVIVVCLTGFLGLGMSLLWRYQLVELPALAVRTIGRVQSSMTTGTTAVYKLPITPHRQEHALSCEVATLKMALSNYGLDIPESELLRYLPFDPTPRSAGVWGNPHEGFVGNIDGQMLRDGYGVYWEPIARLGSRWKRTEVARQLTAAAVAQHIAEGRPVIVWGYFGRGNLASWLTPQGKRIAAVNGEHTRLVVGFSGSPAAPQGFFLLDPIFGPLHWSSTKLLTNMDIFGRTGVVVYPHPRWVRMPNDPQVWEISANGKMRQRINGSWEKFVEYGGYKEAVVPITKQELQRFTLGADLVL